MGSSSSTTAMSAQLVQALRGQPRMTQTALTQAFVEHVRVVESLGQKSDIETQFCPFQLRNKMPWRSVRSTIPLIVLPRGGDVVIIGQETR